MAENNAETQSGVVAAPRASQPQKVMGLEHWLAALALGIALSVGYMAYQQKSQVQQLQAELEERPRVLVVDLMQIFQRLPDGMTFKEKEEVMSLLAKWIADRIRDGYLILNPNAEMTPVSRWRIQDEVLENFIQRVTGEKQALKPIQLPEAAEELERATSRATGTN